MLTLIKPVPDDTARAARMEEALDFALQGEEVRVIATAEELDKAKLQDARILFAICLSKTGINTEYYRMLSVIRTNRLKRRFGGAIGGVLVDGAGELYTKALARELVFAANRAGLIFPGKALVEGTGSLYNFEILGKLLDAVPSEAYKFQTRSLVTKILEFTMPTVEKRRLLAVHAGDRTTSNSLMIWDKVKEKLHDIEITEVTIRNGELVDCRGCPYETCLHFGEAGTCFYGGVIVEQIYPALLSADTLVLISPNYNDAVSANIMAFINRLTALFRTNDFSKKRFYAVVVSGYSGGDLVSQQILGAMNFNKNMILPADFALIETANTPGSILHAEGIGVRAGSFAARILAEEPEHGIMRKITQEVSK